MSDIARLLQIMAVLRTPGSGCPWDLLQNFSSIAPYTIEEAYEVADAIERGNLAEGSGANVFVVHGSRVSTPLARYVLPGITRDVVIELAAAEGIEAVWVEGVLTWRRGVATGERAGRLLRRGATRIEGGAPT